MSEPVRFGGTDDAVPSAEEIVFGAERSPARQAAPHPLRESAPPRMEFEPEAPTPVPPAEERGLGDPAVGAATTYHWPVTGPGRLRPPPEIELYPRDPAAVPPVLLPASQRFQIGPVDWRGAQLGVCFGSLLMVLLPLAVLALLGPTTVLPTVALGCAAAPPLVALALQLRGVAATWPGRSVQVTGRGLSVDAGKAGFAVTWSELQHARVREGRIQNRMIDARTSHLQLIPRDVRAFLRAHPRAALFRSSLRRGTFEIPIPTTVTADLRRALSGYGAPA